MCVETSSGLIISETRRYYLDLKEYQNTREFIFLNSLGGYDTLRTTGEGEYEAAQERTTVTCSYPKEFDASFKQKRNVFTTGIEKLKVNSGWITQEQCEWLQDFLLSEEVYEIKNGKLFPVTITSTSGPKKADKQTPAYFVEFEYEYSNHSSTFAVGSQELQSGDFNDDFNDDFYI